MIWYNDIATFFSYNNLGNFIPSVEMKIEDQLNSLMLFSIYFSLTLIILRRNIKYVYIIIFIGFFTYIFHKNIDSDNFHKKELFDKMNVENDKKRNQIVYKSTKNNPFMNVTIGDYKSFPNRPPAGILEDPDVKESVSRNFEEGLHRTHDDIYKKNASDRQYYTMPSTTIPNKQLDFAKWLYYNPNKTYKETNIEYYE